ncbi:hypothetical protein, partial [Pseudomonas sp. 2822-17]|uniref:hypothetical protein n=1 Tax=Pseudomonas sp. 2822-17 TaxID=1712678 RepID=UPI001304470C
TDVEAQPESQTQSYTIQITELGIHTIQFKAINEAGHETTTSRTIKIDKTAPPKPTIQQSTTSWTNEPVQIAIIAKKDEEDTNTNTYSGLAKIQYRITAEG